MAFAVEPYIFDWIFFDDSSELKNLAVLTNLKNATDVHQRCYISTLYFLVQCVLVYIIRRGLSVLLILERAAKA